MLCGRAPVWRKMGVALTYVLLQLYHEVLRLHGRSRVRPRRVLHAFQMHSDITLELSCTVWIKPFNCSYAYSQLDMLFYSNSVFAMDYDWHNSIYFS